MFFSSTLMVAVLPFTLSFYQVSHFADLSSLSQISLIIHYSPPWVSSARKVRTSWVLGEKENNSRNSNLFSNHRRRRRRRRRRHRRRRRRLLSWRLENQTKPSIRKRILGSQKHGIDILGGHLAQRILAPPPMLRLGAVERIERNKNGKIRRKRRAHQTCNSDAPVVNYLAGSERDRGEANDDVDKVRETKSVAEAWQREERRDEKGTACGTEL